jgi:hypothetical protein
MIEAVRTSETLVNLHQFTQHYNPEDSHLRTHSCENLKCYYVTEVVEQVLLNKLKNKQSLEQKYMNFLCKYPKTADSVLLISHKVKFLKTKILNSLYRESSFVA